MTKKIWIEKDLDISELEYFKSFYFSHSLKETQEHFGISQSTIYKRLERYDIPRTKIESFEDCLARINKKDFTEYYLSHTRKEILAKFNIGQAYLQKILKLYELSKKPKPITELAKQISKAELEEFYLSHTLDETREYFNKKYNISTPHRIVRLLDYYKIDKLNNSKKRIVEYLDNAEKASLHEIASALNLGYCNVTHLIKQLNLEDKVIYTPSRSNYETEIERFLQTLNILYVRQTRQVLANGLELDFYLPDYNLGIEFNGAYWHSSLFKDKKYHLEKSKQALIQGIRLIHIWDYEWDNPDCQQKIKSLIKIATGQSTSRIYARNCTVLEISKAEAKAFINKNHLQNDRPAKINLGLFYQGHLVQVMTFDNTRYNKNLTEANEWEIIRECSDNETIVIGGKNKLFNYFLNRYNPVKVFSYCDFNKFTGRSYEKLNMNFLGYSGPDMKWLMPNGTVINRTPKKNKELKEAAQAKLFGCGSLKYVYKRAD